ncbi:MAG: ATP-dependent zinc metalloprotease FtsH [bacterium]|nr:ATP-dependent zinc metalloprotease FtsH [bacterium]
MKAFSKNIFWAIITLIVISLLFSLFAQTAKAPQFVTLNDLASKINAGEVSKISVNENDLAVDLKNGDKLISKKETESGLSETLKNFGVDPAALRQVSLEVKEASGFKFWINLLVPIVLPLLIIGFIFWLMFKQARSGANQVFSFGRANVKVFAPFKDRITFEDVAGLKEAKQELMEVIDFLKNPKKYLEIGARIPRGILLLGLPGTGKTLIARATAGESNVPFFHMSASEFVEMFVGVGASRVRDLFSIAKKSAPCIVFIDEIDAVGRERGAGLGGGHDEREQTLNQILVEMDGFDRETNVIILAATNRPDILDPALLRPGRFDRRVILDMPDINDREAILKIHCKGKSLGKDIDLRQVAIRTPGFSGADLANLTNEAAILAARQNKHFISQEDLFNSIEKVILGPERRTRAISVKEKELIAYHEAGHALVASGLKDSDPVQKVSIISRGLAGGYTLKLPIEERRIETKSQFLAELAVLFGGYLSESIVFGDISTGASNDLKQATDLAKKLVTRYGMSEKLGPRTFGKTEEMIFLGREITTEKDYSEELAKKIDDEVEALIERAIKAAKKILSSQRKALDAIAKTLLQKESIEREEFDRIIKSFKIQPIKV